MLKVKDIEPWNNSKIVSFNVNCFERELVIIFKDFDEYLETDIRAYLTESYYDWQDDDKGYCLEEYMLEQLPELYKNNITSVLYGEYEEEDV